MINEIELFVCDTCDTVMQTGIDENCICMECGEPMKHAEFLRKIYITDFPNALDWLFQDKKGE